MVGVGPDVLSVTCCVPITILFVLIIAVGMSSSLGFRRHSMHIGKWRSRLVYVESAFGI